MREYVCRDFQSRPDLQGVKTRVGAKLPRTGLPKQTRSSGGQNSAWSARETATHTLPKQTRSSGGQNSSTRSILASVISASKADPIFRGSKRIRTLLCPHTMRFQSRPDLQGVKTRISRMRFSSQSAFQSRPDLQGVKTPSGCCPADQTSKADPIFRGSKQVGERLEHVGGFFQSRPDLQGVKTERVGNPVLIEAGTSKADPIFRGSKLTVAGLYPGEDAFQSRPDLQGVKTANSTLHTSSFSSSKADPIFRGSNREGPRATSGGPIDAKPIVNE